MKASAAGLIAEAGGIGSALAAVDWAMTAATTRAAAPTRLNLFILI
jgi:hypothetical protein